MTAARAIHFARLAHALARAEAHTRESIRRMLPDEAFLHRLRRQGEIYSCYLRERRELEAELAT